MMPRADGRLLAVERVGDVTVARLNGTGFWNDDQVQAVREPLQGLLKQAGRPDLVLELGPVEHLSSSAVGLLVGLHLRARAAGGRVALCGLTPHARSLLERIRVNGILAVYPAREQALASFGPGPQPGA